MSTVARLIRYPRLVIVACYVAIVLGSLALGLRLAERPRLGAVDWLPLVVTVLVGIGVLHYAYTRA